ncbi:MAG: hypothetical protein D6791_18100 [Chloroflexi bacterium]|nr:MAG: hypothetical protein D6791_18100 [Chloroflexota bacterium]
MGVLLVTGTGVVVWRQFDRSSEIEEAVKQQVAPYRFDLTRYEVVSLAEMGYDLVARPGSRLSPAEQRRLVEEYNWRATRIGWLEEEINRIYADPSVPDPEQASAELRRELAELRSLQAALRPVVESILEQQVNQALRELGLTQVGVVWPPVRFNFSNLPRVLIISPRERIEMEAQIQLRPDLDLPTIEAIEEDVAHTHDRSTLIEGLGGLGVWPTMVMDDASLSWVLSTIVHEWVHNYLVFKPLGWHMFDSAAMNTINETVATIVGDEIGHLIANQVYGIPIPEEEPLPPTEEELPEPDPNAFDFRTEMRRTRLHVDKLLAQGRIEEAEAYMEMRRREFVQHGYYIRKLNQAYFAFHGTYATTPASSDPIGPKLETLRDLVPDVATFMQEVEGITRAEELDALLQKWRANAGGAVAPSP